MFHNPVKRGVEVGVRYWRYGLGPELAIHYLWNYPIVKKEHEKIMTIMTNLRLKISGILVILWCQFIKF